MKEGSLNFSGRLGLQQRVLPAYRAPFLDALAATCEKGMSVFAGQPRPEEAISTTDELQVAQFSPAHNRHIGQISTPFYLCWQSGIVSWLGEWNPDILIVEANPRYMSTRRAVNWMHARSRPVLGWGLGVPQVDGSLGRARKPGRQRFLGMFDGVIAYSLRGAEEYRAQGIPEDRVFVATNAVVSPPEGPPPHRPDILVDRPTVLFVGRLQDRKRIDNLIRACAALPDKLQPNLWVVGDGPAKSRLQYLAGEIYPQAEFPGTLLGPDLEAYFRKADLFVLPGTGGLAVQQAMAYGLPVVVAEGDGTQEDLVRPENGWRISPGDQDELKDTLREALSDVSHLRRKGINSYLIVRDEANIQGMVSVFVEALNRLMML
jgi:glycosyltransferase involved in cell wall biosynthesis